jgi:chromosome segregation ATPase
MVIRHDTRVREVKEEARRMEDAAVAGNTMRLGMEKREETRARVVQHERDLNTALARAANERTSAIDRLTIEKDDTLEKLRKMKNGFLKWFKTCRGKVRSAQEDAEELRVKCDDLRRRLQAFSYKSTTLSMEATDDRNEILTLQAEARIMSEEANTCRAALDTHKQNTSSIRSHLCTLTRSLQQFAHDSTKKIQALEEKVESLQAENEELIANNERMTFQQHESEAREGKLQESPDVNVNQLGDLEWTLTMEQQRLAMEQESLAIEQESLAMKQEETHRHRQTILQRERKDHARTKKELVSARKQVVGYRAALEIKDGTINRMANRGNFSKGQVTLRETNRSEKEESSGKIKRLSDDIDKANDDIAELQRVLDGQTQETTKLQDQLKTVNMSKDQSNRHMSYLREQYAALESCNYIQRGRIEYRERSLNTLKAKLKRRKELYENGGNATGGRPSKRRA